MCAVWQFCAGAGCAPAASCWIGALGTCTPQAGWQSRSRVVKPTPPPAPGNQCSDPRCEPGTDDSGWQLLDLPDDFIVKGNFSKTAV
jgi:hypothetical protein